VAVLVGTSDGVHAFRSDGMHEHALAGHAVDALTGGPGGTWIAIVDGTEIWQLDDAAWSCRAQGDHELVSLACADDVVYAGTADARMVRVRDGDVQVLPAFDTAPGRDEWHQVGSPIQVRSLTATCDGTVMLANVHVGGVLRSLDHGESWTPTMPVDDDVHEVVAHPDRPEVVVAAAAIGLLRSDDAGATWHVETRGLASTYSRAVAPVGDRLFLSNADGPFSRTSRLLTAPLDVGALEPVGHALPDEVAGMIDTRFVAARDDEAAFGTRADQVWARQGDEPWTQLAADFDGITCVALV